jgi:ribonuclease P protein component
VNDTRFRLKERLTQNKQYQAVFERKRSVSNQNLVLYATENHLEFSRLGISISRRKTKTAVARNSIKRIVREAFRTSKDQLPKGLDLVVVPRGQPLSFAQTRLELVELAQILAVRLRAAAKRKSGP